MHDLLFFGVGVILVTFRLWWVVGHQVVYLPGQRLQITGTIASEPEVSNWKQTLAVGDFQIEVPRWPEYRAGEWVRVTGVVIVNSNRRSDFMPRPTIVTADSVTVLDENGGLAGFIMGVRRKADEITKEILPEPQAGLLSGIVWGGRQGLPKEFVESLKRTSTMHVVAASGMNVTLIAQFFISALLVVLTRRWAIVVGILGIGVYVLAAGGMGQPSVVRAGIMATSLLVAQFFGRQYDGIRFLVATGVVMLILNPLWLFEVGWQMSMAATAGLMVIGNSDRFAHAAMASPEIFRARLPQAGSGCARKIWVHLWSLVDLDFRTSVAATLATLPIMVGNFGQLSLVAPLVNALVLWVVAPLMVIGLLILPLGLIYLPLAQIVGWVGWALLSYFVLTVESFGRLGLAAVEGVSFPWWMGVLYYGILIYAVRVSRSRPGAGEGTS